jgi:hypothetical protein
MPRMTMVHERSFLRVMGVGEVLYISFCIIKVKIGPAVAIVCNILKGRKNCAPAMTKPYKINAKCLLSNVLNVFLLLYSILMPITRQSPYEPTTITIERDRLVSMGVNLCSLAYMYPQTQVKHEMRMKMYDLVWFLV